MPEDDQSTVDVGLCEVGDAPQLVIACQNVSIDWTTKQSVDDVFSRCIVVLNQQMLTRYWSCRPCSSSSVSDRQLLSNINKVSP